MLAHRAALALIPHMHKSAQTYAAIFGNPYQHKKMEKQLLFWLVSGTVLNFAVPRSLFISCLYVRIYRPTEIYTCMHLRVCTVYTRTLRQIHQKNYYSEQLCAPNKELALGIMWILTTAPSVVQAPTGSGAKAQAYHKS